MNGPYVKHISFAAQVTTDITPLTEAARGYEDKPGVNVPRVERRVGRAEHSICGED